MTSIEIFLGLVVILMIVLLLLDGDDDTNYPSPWTHL